MGNFLPCFWQIHKMKVSSLDSSSLLQAPIEALTHHEYRFHSITNICGEVAAILLSIEGCVTLQATTFSLLDKILTAAILLRLLLPINMATTAVIKDISAALGGGQGASYEGSVSYLSGCLKV